MLATCWVMSEPELAVACGLWSATGIQVLATSLSQCSSSRHGLWPDLALRPTGSL